MDIAAEKHGTVMLLSLQGRIDASTSSQLEEAFVTAINSGDKHFAVDFAQIDYISSAGLRVLLSAVKKLKQQEGKMVLVGLKEQVKEVFDIAGFSPIFPTFSSQEEALKSFAE